MDLKKLVVEPLLAFEEAVHRETGTVPIVEVVVHSRLFDEMCGQIDPDGARGVAVKPGGREQITMGATARGARPRLGQWLHRVTEPQ